MCACVFQGFSLTSRPLAWLQTQALQTLGVGHVGIRIKIVVLGKLMTIFLACCVDKDVKKAYRKLALKYHPDCLNKMPYTLKTALTSDDIAGCYKPGFEAQGRGLRERFQRRIWTGFRCRQHKAEVSMQCTAWGML